MTSLTAAAAPLDPIAQARIEILNQILTFAAVLNTVITLFLALEAWQQEQVTIRLLIGLFVTGCTWPLAFNRRWPAGPRTGIALGLILIPAVGSLLIEGIAGAGPFFWIFASSFSLLVIGWRFGWLMAAIGTMAIAATGWAVNQGFPLFGPTYEARTALTVRGQTAIADIFIFITVSTLLIMGLRHLIKTIRLSILSAEELARALEQEAEELEHKVMQRVHLIETGAAINRHLSSLLEEKALISLATEALANARHYDHTAVFLVHDRLELIREASPAAGDRREFQPGTGWIGAAAASGRPELFAANQEGEENEQGWASPEVRWALAVPILLHDTTLGVLTAEHSQELTDDDIFLLSLIANQLAVGLRNARLYQGMQRQTALQIALHQINTRFKDGESIEEILQIAGEGLAATLGAQRVRSEIGRFYVSSPVPSSQPPAAKQGGQGDVGQS